MLESQILTTAKHRSVLGEETSWVVGNPRPTWSRNPFPTPAAFLALSDFGPSVSLPRHIVSCHPELSKCPSHHHTVPSARLILPLFLTSLPLPLDRLATHQGSPQMSPPPRCAPSFPWAEVTAPAYSQVHLKTSSHFLSRSLSFNICKMARMKVPRPKGLLWE